MCSIQDITVLAYSFPATLVSLILLEHVTTLLPHGLSISLFLFLEPLLVKMYMAVLSPPSSLFSNVITSARSHQTTLFKTLSTSLHPCISYSFPLLEFYNIIYHLLVIHKLFIIIYLSPDYSLSHERRNVGLVCSFICPNFPNKWLICHVCSISAFLNE